MAGEKRQITRNRISYSCQRCRQRKVKCDKVHPTCGSCQKNDEECVYASNEPDQQQQNGTTTADIGRGKRRRQSLSGSQHEDTDHEDVANGENGLHHQLSQLNVLLNRLSGIAGIDLNGTGGPAIPAQERSNHSNISSGMEQNRMPNLDSISAQLETFTNLLRTQQFNITRKTVTEADVPEPKATSHPLLPTDLNDPLTIPNEQQRNVLFRCWLSSVYPVLPIVDPSTVLMHYRTFHFWYMYGLEKGIPNPVEEFVPLIYAIYYAGLMSMSGRGFRRWFPNAKRRKVLESARVQFMITLKAPAKQLANPFVLAARVMMCHMCAPEGCDIGPASTTWSLIRTAYSCNLHRERPNEALDCNIAELRRRLWWETVIVDTMEASARNIPPLINHHFCDTSMISEIKDRKLSTPEANKYTSKLHEGHPPDTADDPTTNDRSSIVSVINLVMKARTVLASNARNLLNINLAAKPKTKEDMIEIRKNLDCVDRFVNSIINRIPAKGIPELNFGPNKAKPGQSFALDHGSVYGDDLISSEVETICGVYYTPESWEIPYVSQHRHALIAFHRWARMSLSMLIDQLYCFSYAPFLHNTRRRVWMSARQCALKHAHSNLRKYNALAADLEVERFRWTWATMFHPIHACVILLLDTYEYPTSREAPRSRALIDEMLSLSSPEHGIVGGDNGISNNKPLSDSGNEAFSMLVELREKAWHKAGLDPILLWTEQDQIDIGVATPLDEAEKLAQSIREDTVLASSSMTEHNSRLNFLRSSVETRSKEHFHPSDIATPDDIEQGSLMPTPTNCVKYVNSIQTHPKPESYKRARPDQEHVPASLTTHPNPFSSQQGHLYNFRLPSELYDVGQLIRKIKSFQQQRSANPETTPATTAESMALCEQLATSNAELGSMLATEVARNPPQTNNTLNTSQPVDTVAPPATASGNTAAQNPPLQSHDGTASNAGDSVGTPQPNDSTSADGFTDQSRGPEQMNMDFDWEKWDEIFGHILDDGFDGQFDFMATLDMDMDGGGDGDGAEAGFGY